MKYRRKYFTNGLQWRLEITLTGPQEMCVVLRWQWTHWYCSAHSTLAWSALADVCCFHSNNNSPMFPNTSHLYKTWFQSGLTASSDQSWRKFFFWNMTFCRKLYDDIFVSDKILDTMFSQEQRRLADWSEEHDPLSYRRQSQWANRRPETIEGNHI